MLTADLPRYAAAAKGAAASFAAQIPHEQCVFYFPL